MDTTILITIGNLFFTPVMVLLTLAIKGKLESGRTKEKREDGFITDLQERVKMLEKRLDEKDKEAKEIRIELKNRDAEYVKLYQENATLKAKYEVLHDDHEELKKKYEITANELTVLKDDIKLRAAAATEAANKL